MTVTFFGNRNASSQIKPRLKQLLVNLIEKENANLFYVGNQGGFDRNVAGVLSELKNEYPHIKYYIVLAYMPGKKKDFDYLDYSKTIFPDDLEKVPPKFAIFKRNCWMIKNSDAVITFAEDTTGNAAFFENMAIKKDKKVIPL